MRVRFIAAARLEFLAEVVYYSKAQPGLGERFSAAVEEATARAEKWPRKFEQHDKWKLRA